MYKTCAHDLLKMYKNYMNQTSTFQTYCQAKILPVRQERVDKVPMLTSAPGYVPSLTILRVQLSS